MNLFFFIFHRSFYFSSLGFGRGFIHFHFHRLGAPHMASCLSVVYKYCCRRIIQQEEKGFVNMNINIKYYTPF